MFVSINIYFSDESKVEKHGCSEVSDYYEGNYHPQPAIFWKKRVYGSAMQILMICDCWIRGVWEPIKNNLPMSSIENSIFYVLPTNVDYSIHKIHRVTPQEGGEKVLTSILIYFWTKKCFFVNYVRFNLPIASIFDLKRSRFSVFDFWTAWKFCNICLT